MSRLFTSRSSADDGFVRGLIELDLERGAQERSQAGRRGRGYESAARESYLESKGFDFNTFDRTSGDNSHVSNYKKLKAGRIDLWPMPDAVAYHVAKTEGDDPAALLKRILPLTEISTGYYLAASLQTSDETVKTIRIALESLSPRLSTRQSWPNGIWQNSLPAVEQKKRLSAQIADSLSRTPLCRLPFRDSPYLLAMRLLTSWSWRTILTISASWELSISSSFGSSGRLADSLLASRL